MHTERFTLRAAAHLFLVQEGKILLLRRCNTGYQDGKYSVVAGHLDGGENVKKAMSREAKEEAGLHIHEDDLDIVHVMHRIEDGEERVDFFLATEKWEGEVVNRELDKCDDLSWFSLEEMPSNMIPYVQEALSHFQKKNPFSTFGW